MANVLEILKKSPCPFCTGAFDLLAD